MQKRLANIDEKLNRLSGFLTLKTSLVSKRRKMMVLILFCGVWSCYSTVLIIENLKAHEHFRRPASIQFLPLHRTSVPRPFMTEKEFQNIHHFKLILDSLHSGSKQKTKIDDLLLRRPHLLDSLQYLEQLYQNQIKNKAYEK
ncbi:MAG: hypothetical protein ACJ75B_01770 [Flavisolibacter sp.]